MVHDDSLDHDKKIKIENFLHKLSEKEYSEDDISKAEKKAEASYKSRLSDIWDRVRILFLIARHPSIWGPQMALLATIAVIYLVSPVDVIPDLIPVAGLSDDIAVIGAIAALIIKSLSGYSREKLKAIRAEVPDDLRAAFDEMFKLKAEEEQDAGNLDDEQKKKVMASVEKLGTTAGIDAFSEIDDKLPSMNRGPVQAVWDKVQFMWNKFRSGCTGLEKILVTGALLYLILPADVIPDFLPGVGLVDDVFAITYVYYKIGGGKEKAAEALRHFTDKVADRIRVRIEPMIEQKVQQELEKWNKDRLLLSLMNLLIYVMSALLILFPVFGLLPSSILSSVLLASSIVFALYRIIRFLRNGYSVPIAKSIMREKNIKKGISAYIRTLDRRIPVAEKYFDSYFRFIGEDENRGTLDRLIEYVWKLERRNLVLFALTQIFIVLLFLVVRYALMKSMGDLSFWEILLYPFIAVIDSFK